MATTPTKYLSLERLQQYDGLMKEWTVAQIEATSGKSVKYGYYYEGSFYEDALHTVIINPSEDNLYVDVTLDINKLYRYNGTNYDVVSDADFNANLNTTTIACGGIPKGTDLTNKTLQEVLELLLAPYVAPSSLSLSITKTPSGYMEYGTSSVISKASASWVKGSTNIGSAVLSGAASGTVSNPDTSALFDFDDIIVSDASIKTFTVTLNITGHDSVTKTSSVSNSYIYPMYYGAVDKTAANLTAADIQSKTKAVVYGTQTFSFTTSDSYPMIATTRMISKVTDSSGITDYTAAFGTPTEINLTSISPSWGPVKFYVYTGSKASLSGFQFKFTF